jgi:hypothetical protein
MAGKFSGVRTRIQTEIPEAYYVHCYAHCLNLAVVKSCQLPIVCNTIFNCLAFRSPPVPRSSRVSIINACADLNMLSASALLDHRVSHKKLLFFFVNQEHLIALHLPVVTWF